ncbi:MAG TPA: hypothetical protein VFC19_20545 [Candidatus Limnocylindrales bacterium]|nr:hypothetical protein [Candidatus Limnocylindrales bacterium]
MNRRHLRHARAIPVLGVAILLVGIAVSPATATDPQAVQATLTATPAPTATTPVPVKEEIPGGAPNERPPGGFATWDELIAAQNKLNGAADYILSADSSDSAGYASTVVAPESGQVLMYWQGAVPADVQARAAQTGVPVRFLAARYSADELASENTRLGADPRVFTTGPNVDGSGITVTVGNEADAAAIRAEARVAATVSVGPKPQLLFDRQNDITPYWGGARWDNLSLGFYCSTGFAVDFFGQRKMLTAGHCGNNGNVARIGAPGQPNTTLSLDVNPRDTLMIDRPPLRNFDGRIYSGGIYSSASRDVVFNSPAIDYVGNWICTGGARTGEHCNAQVTLVDTTVLGITPLTYAVAGVNTCIAAPGDSGGPTFSFASTLFNVRGRGTITAGVLNTACLADSGSRVPPPIITTGSRVVWYAPLQRPFFSPNIGSLQFYGATIL